MTRVIISAPGSRGDVNPMIAVGRHLRRAGHDVVISLAEPYADAARTAGLTVEAVINQKRFSEVLGNSQIWKPIGGPVTVFRHIARDYLSLHAEVIRKYHLPGRTILISHPLDLASRIFRDADPSTPLVDIHLQPVTLRTFDAPPRLSPWPIEITRPPWALKSAYWLVDHCVIDPIVRGPVNRMRASFGLPPVRRIYHRWWMSPDRILAMYPRWYAPATESFEPRLVHCGFPLEDVDGETFSTPENRPIAFTSGTAHHDCRAFFDRAVEACIQLNRPGLLLSTYDANFPSDLPASIQTMGYASFRRLLPSCAAIVHHGGVGTTSQAMAAGIPQVICPLAFDQFDNATRIERLGCGLWCRRASDLTAVLRAALTNAERDQSPFQQVAKRLQTAGSAAARAAAECEKCVRQRLDR